MNRSESGYGRPGCLWLLSCLMLAFSAGVLCQYRARATIAWCWALLLGTAALQVPEIIRLWRYGRARRAGRDSPNP